MTSIRGRPADDRIGVSSWFICLMTGVPGYTLNARYTHVLRFCAQFYAKLGIAYFCWGCSRYL